MPPAEQMIRQLVDGLETVARTLRAGFRVADAAADQPTADLLAQRMEIHEKNAWMQRSLLEQGGDTPVAGKKKKKK